MKNFCYFSFIHLFVFFTSAIAQNTNDDLSKKVIEQVAVYYAGGEYRAVINSLEYTLPQLNESAKPEAHKYLALSYAALGNIPTAREHFRTALSLNAKMILDTAMVSPDIMELVWQVKKDISREGAMCSCFIPGWGQMAKGETRKGCIVLGGSVATVVTSVLLWFIAEDRHDDYLALGYDDQARMDSYYHAYDRWYKAALLSSTVFAGIYVYGFYDALSVNKTSITDQFDDIKSKRVRIGYKIKF